MLYRLSPRLLAVLLALALCAGAAVRVLAGSGAWVLTDKADYAPGEIVQITAGGFEPNEIVTLQVKHLDGTAEDIDWHDRWFVLTDENGQFRTDWVVGEDAVGKAFKLIARGDKGSYAETAFTDSVSGALITSPTSSSPRSITSLPDTVRVNFAYTTGLTGATTGVARVKLGGTEIGSATKSLSPGVNQTSFINVPIPAGTSNGTYDVEVTVTNSDGSGANSKTDTKRNSVVVNAPFDTTAPTTSASLQGTAGNNGWYTSAVMVTLSATDTGGSGVANTFYKLDGGSQSTYSAPFTVSTDSSNHTVEFWSVDNATNQENPHKSVSFKIDKTAPTISGAPDRASNANGWYKADVLVSFTASDATSGVASVTGPQTLGEGADQSVSGTAVDLAGNSASTTVSGINIDKTAPEVELLSRLPAANANGWNNTDVTATFRAADALSGIADDSTATLTFTQEGANQSASQSFTDRAGNTASGAATGVNIDKTAPSISGAADRAPNGNGWYDADVTVTFTGDDALSGVESLTSPTILGEGANQSMTGVATDRAGNSASSTVGGINIDETAPVVTLKSRVPQASSYGWNNTDVTAIFEATDALSGIDGSEMATVTFADEGQDQSAGRSFTDRAGNSATGVVTGINIDKTAPTVAPSPAPQANANGWNNSDVTVSFTCSDALSGVASCPADATLTTEGAGQEVTGTAVDKAGNTAPATATINIDKTAPTINGAADRAPNANGWYNADVTVSFTGSDVLSGVESLTDPRTISSEGKDQSASGKVVDKAGNSACAKVSGINIDKTEPSIEIAAPVEGGKWLYGTTLTAQYAITDTLSGIDESLCSGTVNSLAPNFLSGDALVTTNPGTNTFVVCGADVAGNKTSKAVQYRVVYDCTAFLPPINTNGDRSIFKLGSTIPVKFRLNGGSAGLNVEKTASLAVAYAGPFGPLNVSVNEPSEFAPSSTSFRYDPSSAQYIYNMSTKGWQEGWYLVRIRLGDGEDRITPLAVGVKK